mmetsp:Transcript_3587/g.9053  ORF Transcript_3587/g.9053 Transcript_3587/m.9053 type:complete len:139 (+) Transcript_3587:57-473(+)
MSRTARSLCHQSKVRNRYAFCGECCAGSGMGVRGPAGVTLQWTWGTVDGGACRSSQPARTKNSTMRSMQPTIDRHVKRLCQWAIVLDDEFILVVLCRRRPLDPLLTRHAALPLPLTPPVPAPHHIVAMIAPVNADATA